MLLNFHWRGESQVTFFRSPRLTEQLLENGKDPQSAESVDKDVHTLDWNVHLTETRKVY